MVVTKAARAAAEAAGRVARLLLRGRGDAAGAAEAAAAVAAAAGAAQVHNARANKCGSRRGPAAHAALRAARGAGRQDGGVLGLPAAGGVRGAGHCCLAPAHAQRRLRLALRRLSHDADRGAWEGRRGVHGEPVHGRPARAARQRIGADSLHGPHHGRHPGRPDRHQDHAGLPARGEQRLAPRRGPADHAPRGEGVRGAGQVRAPALLRRGGARAAGAAGAGRGARAAAADGGGRGEAALHGVDAGGGGRGPGAPDSLRLHGGGRRGGGGGGGPRRARGAGAAGLCARGRAPGRPRRARLAQAGSGAVLVRKRHRPHHDASGSRSQLAHRQAAARGSRLPGCRGGAAPAARGAQAATRGAALRGGGPALPRGRAPVRGGGGDGGGGGRARGARHLRLPQPHVGRQHRHGLRALGPRPPGNAPARGGAREGGGRRGGEDALRAHALLPDAQCQIAKKTANFYLKRISG